jgi:DNA-binding transcriptional LysR family regulator
MARFSNINSIMAFVTVAREGSVSRAAERLNLTQPAISHQIKRLSNETGLNLFMRTAKGFQITADGVALLSEAEKVLSAMNDFERVASTRQENLTGSLKIGTIVDPEFIRLGQLLKHLSIEYPYIETELTHGVSGEILIRLCNEQIDVGFYLSSPEEDLSANCDSAEPVQFVKLADFHYNVIGPAGWQKRIEGASWADLAALPWIGTPGVSVHNRLLKSIFAECGCKQNIVALVDQEASMLEMVRSGVGLSLCRASLALHEKQSFGLAIASNISIPACLGLVVLERNRSKKNVGTLLELIKRIWAER